VEVNGVLMKKGDIVSCPSMVANRDPMEFPNPEKSICNAKIIATPPLPMGRTAASVRIWRGVKSWSGWRNFWPAFPNFRIKPGTTPMTFGGYVFGVENLILDWSA
jgi:hypothetical protein